MPHELPPLPYPYDALEPHLDARTLEFHHDKHHAAYVNNLNKALEGHPELQDMPLEELIRNLDRVPEAIRGAVRNNAGQHYNHSLYWESMCQGGGGEPTGELAEAILAAFGSFEEFKAKLSSAAATQFGSGWAWLYVDGGALKIGSTANAESPLEMGGAPLLTVDVWEHAYYLVYQNRRPDYIEAWWSLVDWEAAARRYAAAK